MEIIITVFEKFGASGILVLFFGALSLSYKYLISTIATERKRFDISMQIHENDLQKIIDNQNKYSDTIVSKMKELVTDNKQMAIDNRQFIADNRHHNDEVMKLLNKIFIEVKLRN